MSCGHATVRWQKLLTAAGYSCSFDRDVVAFPGRSKYDLVGIVNVDAGYKQARHLLDLCCRRICYVTRPGRVGTMDARITGFRSALCDAGLTVAGDGVYAGDVDDPKFLRKVMRAKPDGIVCFNDPVAVRLISGLDALKVKVPEKVKVIGIDGLDSTRFLKVPLTTFRQPLTAIGDAAAALMAQRLNGDNHPPRQVLFDVELLVRESTGESGKQGKEMSERRGI